MYYILNKEIQESHEGLGDYILKISTNIEELLEWINIKIEEKEFYLGEFDLWYYELTIINEENENDSYSLYKNTYKSISNLKPHCFSNGKYNEEYLKFEEAIRKWCEDINEKIEKYRKEKEEVQNMKKEEEERKLYERLKLKYEPVSSEFAKKLP